jgi:hypothetical protein
MVIDKLHRFPVHVMTVRLANRDWERAVELPAIISSTATDMTQSYQRTRMALLNTGNHRSRSNRQKMYLGYGPIRVQQTCTNLRRYVKQQISSCTVSHRFGRPKQHQPVSPCPLTRIPSSHSLSPTAKYVYSLSSQANSPESMTNPSQLYKRCSRPGPLYTKSTIWSSADGLPWSGSWKCLDLMAIFLGCGAMRFGMRVGHLYCIRRCLGSRVGGIW